MNLPAAKVSCSENFCYSAYRLLNDSTYLLERQGCWEHKHGCNQSACMAIRNDSKPFLFCCCNSDFCNTNFVQTTPKTSPVIVSPEDSSARNYHGKIRFRNSAMWISFASTSIMLVIIGVVFFISCRSTKQPKPRSLRESSPLAPSGPGYSSNLYNVDNLKPISIIGEGK